MTNIAKTFFEALNFLSRIKEKDDNAETFE